MHGTWTRTGKPLDLSTVMCSLCIFSLFGSDLADLHFMRCIVGTLDPET